MSSALRSLMNRLFLSAAVKKRFVRLVSTLMISSESCGSSSRRGVGEGDAIGNGATPSLVADKLREANPPHTQRKTKTNNRIGRLISRYCILLPTSFTALH